MQIRDQLFINGEWVDASDGGRFEVFDPADMSELAQCAAATADDVGRAVAAAKACHESGAWNGGNIMGRSAILHKAAAIIAENMEFLAELESRDVGKPIIESKNFDIPGAAGTVEYFADLAVDVCGEQIPTAYDEVLDYTIREPLGVIGAIVPWNFPFLCAARKIASALAAGNTVIIKPSSWAPLTTVLMGEIFQEAGLPEGALGILTGPGGVTGEAMTNHPDIHEISFTGSTEVGRSIMSSCVHSLKGCGLELGGKSPALVFPDCDMDETIAGTLFGAYLNQGECCCAATRMLVHEAVYDEYVEKFVAGSAGIKMGMPLEDDTRMGAMVHPKQTEVVLNYINKGLSEGCKLALGGKQLTDPPFDRGTFLPPTVFVDVDRNATISQEEIFGPVAVITKCKDEAEMVEMANDTCYGLTSSVWTTNLKTGHKMAKVLKAGTVWMNLHNFVMPMGPYGGYKDSGIGRELGMEGLKELTQVKNVMISLYEEGFKWY
jgi:acyl-CoA reductase-like NAD-dependent aldehyde dehydrogenase